MKVANFSLIYGHFYIIWGVLCHSKRFEDRSEDLPSGGKIIYL